MNIWDEIKNRFTCRDIAHEYGVNLSKKKAVCPFCQYKKNPSFYVTDDYFICHHCQKKGDLFNLMAEFEETDRWGALKILCHRAGINYTPSKQDEERENVSQILKLFCQYFLIRDENSPPWKYLIDRGLTPDLIKQKLVGFIPNGSSFSSLPENLKKSKYLKEKKLPGFLSGRILLPFWQENQIVYLTGRTLHKREEKKYLNITGQKTWTGNMRGPELIVTEGIFDQLLAEQAGFNCIATAGAGGKIKIHKRIKKILLCFDGDDQGRKYIEKYAMDFYEQGANVKICLPDEGTDLADFICERGKIEDLKKIGIFDFYFDQLSNDSTNKEIKAKLYRILKRVDDIERELRFKQLKKLFGVTISVIRKDYFNSLKNNRDDFLTYDGIKFKVPEGYLITKHGIFTGTHEQISFEPVYISRCGINRQNGVEYVELSFNSNGNTKRRIVDRITISSVSELIKESQYGAPVNSGNALHIINFLAAWISVNKENFDSFEVVHQLGWFKNQFILTDRIIG
ncbi:MAG: CHC2 zinc finger domain-containing protein, partial [Candidatus Aminicenantes bacterium]